MNTYGPQKLTAGFASTWDDERLTGVTLAEREDSSGWSIVFERALAPTEKDREAGQDTYCITTRAGNSVCGGVIRWAIEGNQLVLTLDERTSEHLCTENLWLRCEIAIDLPADKVAELTPRLSQILAK
jgi:hypothetical protein